MTKYHTNNRRKSFNNNGKKNKIPKKIFKKKLRCIFFFRSVPGNTKGLKQNYKHVYSL